MPRSIYNRPLKAKRPDSKRPDRSEAKLLARMFADAGDPNHYEPIYEAMLGKGNLPPSMSKQFFEKTLNKRIKLGKLIVDKGRYDFETYYQELEPALKEMAAHLRKNAPAGNKPVFNEMTIREAIHEIDKKYPPITLIDYAMNRSWLGKPVSEILKMRGLKRS